MPYIPQVARRRSEHTPTVSGELNYAITQLIVDYLTDNLNYSAINDALGALEGAKLELYRRVAAPYEDRKRKENGDVYL